MRVLSVSSEMYPLIKTGGLADVVGALPHALEPLGIEMRTIIPAYHGVLERLGESAEEVLEIPRLMGHKASIWQAETPGGVVYALDCPAFFHRSGGPYTDMSAHEWPDNWRRFAAFSQAAAMIGEGELEDWRPDVVHAHDWQAAMSLAYMRFGPSSDVARVMTIHNLAFQGRFPADIFPELELPEMAWAVDGVEYYGGTGYLKAGMVSADAITTVSPTYAEEIKLPENGMGLDGLLKGREDKLHGILNGIDTDLWDPVNDDALANNFSAEDVDAKVDNKRALEERMGLDKEDSPLIVVISRLTWQKGLDVLLNALDDLVAGGARFAVLGTGEHMLEGGFLAASHRHAGRVSVRVGYEEAQAHFMMAGGDAILIPSRFEPCGLTQLYGLRYGCVPVVARVGGLADTVIDANEAAVASKSATGVVFDAPTPYHINRAIDRLHRLYADPDVWRGMQTAAMKCDFSWARSARRYAELYRGLKQQAPEAA